MTASTSAPASPQTDRPVLRSATAQDLPAIATVDGRAFGETFTDAELEDFTRLYDPDRFLLATDPGDGRIIGVTCDFPFTMTLPGGGQLDVPGVSWVSVAVEHRRRGVLRALLGAQHRRYLDDGVVLSALTASEGGIYGRFGYGPATVGRAIEVDRRLTGVRATAAASTPLAAGVRHADAATARAHAPGVHERWRARTPGALSRSEVWWDLDFLDRPEQRRGGSALFHLVHPDGWASYRVHRREHRAEVVDLVAATDAAHAALWRTLLSLDLVHVIAARTAGLEDPLPHLLTDSRQVLTTGVRDGMWVRLLDVPAALAARRYAVEVDVVVEVADDFLGRGGRFRLHGGPDGATCEPTSAAAQVTTDVATLGSAYLGGHRLATMARAGLVAADDGAALTRLDLALTTDRAPWHGTDF